jgi:hypothetical protein
MYQVKLQHCPLHWRRLAAHQPAAQVARCPAPLRFLSIRPKPRERRTETDAGSDTDSDTSFDTGNDMLPPEVGTKAPCCIQQPPGAASRSPTAAATVATRQLHARCRSGRPASVQHAVMLLPLLLLQIGEALARVLGDSGFRRRSAPHLAAIIMIQGEGVIPEGAPSCPPAVLLDLHTSELPHMMCKSQMLTHSGLSHAHSLALRVCHELTCD